jgi:lipoprotein NlpI
MIRMFVATLIFASTFFAAEALPPLAPPYEGHIFDGRNAEEKGLLGKALESYKKAQDLNPKRPDAYFYAARVLITQRKHEEAVAALTKLIELQPESATPYQMRGGEYFKLGEIEKSIQDFDKYISFKPEDEAEHWQRGISYYYAGKYSEGRRQFEKHQTVNSNDVENAVWHFLCLARAENFETARKALIPITGDQRVPMTQIFDLFAGKGTEADIWKAVEVGKPSPTVLEQRKFFAHLYLGLYYEAKGDAQAAYEHMKKAATEFASDHYMGDVAKVHFKRLLANPPKPSL